jgi:hypothetical protein
MRAGRNARDGWLCGLGIGDNAIAVALGCWMGEDMHAPTERIRADSIAVGARQLRAVLAEPLDEFHPSKPIESRGTKSAANRQGLHRVAPRRP